MKRLFIIIGICMAMFAQATSDCKKAPQFNLKGLDGNDYSLEQMKGNVVVGYFYRSTCPSCILKVAMMKDLDTEFQGDPVKILGLSYKETVEAMKSYAEKYQIGYPLLRDPDGATFEAYGVKAIPHLVVIGKCGKLAAVYPGGGEFKEIVATIDSLLTDEE